MTAAKDAWRTFRTLSGAQRRILLQAWLLLPLVVSGLRLFGFRRVWAVLGEGGARSLPYDLATAQRVAFLVDGAACWSPVPVSCLGRSLVLCYLLRGQGVAAELQIGVARADGRITFHAWVEHEGVALNDSQDVAARYATFDPALLRVGGGLL